MSQQPQLSPVSLQITPAIYERAFWQTSQQWHRTASFLDWWSLWCTLQNSLHYIRFMKGALDTVVDAEHHLFWCPIIMYASLAQAAWRLLAPSHYHRCRFWVVLLNRYPRLLPNHLPRALAQA
jgi:hypothetical protein